MPKGFGDVVRPMSGNLGELSTSDRPVDALCRIARAGFTGLLYVERDDGTGAVFSMRSGRVVFVEDLGEAQSIPDMLLERGLITKSQYVDIASLVVDSLAENEDLAFCELAVRSGVLSQRTIDTELEQRVRGRVIQAISWEGCRLELEPDPEMLTGIREYPQDIGPLVYVGVRTFFDEERVRSVLGDHDPMYVRLTRPLDEAAALFAFEREDVALLSRIRPERPFNDAVDEAGADPFEAMQLLCMLAAANMLEVGAAPLSSAERSGVRSAKAMDGRHRAMGSVREERVGPTEPRSRPGTPHPGSTSQRGMSAVGASAASGPSAPRSTRYSSSTMEAVRPEKIGATHPSVEPAARGSMQGKAPAASHPAAPTPPPSVPSGQPDHHAARARNRPRKLGAALKRLDRELKQIKVPPPSVPETSSKAPAAPSAAKTHLEQLRKMRAAALTQKAAPGETAPPERAAGDHFRAAQEAMREQQFPRALEHLRKACEAAPDNEIYAIYRDWASFRGGALDDEGIAKLRGKLREKVSDDQLKGFAYYALGHIAAHEKKDEAAEKFFRKAVELDKHNKDAERHLRIIELRRKTAAAEEKSSKIFGIEIKKRG